MAYRLKHLPTGLYYYPSRSVRMPGSTWQSIKSNLSKKGKAYLSRPSLSWTTTIYDEQGNLIRTLPKDWILETC